jgi:hypothetical protein
MRQPSHYEIIFLSEIPDQKKSHRVRVIGILEIFSPVSGRLSWQDQAIAIDLEYVRFESQVKSMSLYQVLGEIQESVVSRDGPHHHLMVCRTGVSF